MKFYLWIALLFTDLVLRCIYSTKLTCPASVELGSSVNLSCSYFNQVSVNFFNPDNIIAANCIKDTCHYLNKRVTVTYINSNHSVLSVTEIKLVDEGEWACQSGGDKETRILSLYKIPSCRISSKQNTRNILPDQELSLSLFVTDSYCSGKTGFTLNTGNVSTEINRRLSNGSAGIGSETFQTNISVTESHFGSVSMTFSCGNERWDIGCEGIHKLQQVVGLGNVKSKKLVIPFVSSAAGVIFIVTITVLLAYLVKRKLRQVAAMERLTYSNVNDAITIRLNTNNVTDIELYTEVDKVEGRTRGGPCEPTEPPPVSEVVHDINYESIDDVMRSQPSPRTATGNEKV